MSNNVRHVLWDGWAGPATGPWMGGRCPQGVPGQVGPRACPAHPQVTGQAGDVCQVSWDGQARPAMGPGTSGRCPPRSWDGRARLATGHGTGGLGSPQVQGQAGRPGPSTCPGRGG
ncbi:collagen alpha-1(III) chain-like [Macrobrachium nipponense]|uniref:collagen alpha-1(III) chain-like n=1 Tax=Macrobrachium nipponense TaxID=159736 RepID=UPI0030C83BF0